MWTRIVSLILLAPLAALGIKFALLELVPGDMAAKLIWAGLLFPVLWPLLMFYAYWPENPRTPAILLTAVSLLSGAIVALA